MSKIVKNIVAVLAGLVISPFLALFCGVIVGAMAFVDFWVGLLMQMKANNSPSNITIEPKTVWDKHIARLDAEKQNKNTEE